MSLRVRQIGPYPPPWGGVSIHVRRLHEFLRHAGHDAQVLDMAGRSFGEPGVRPFLLRDFAAGLFGRRAVYHIHFSAAGLWLLAQAAFLLRHRVVMSVHNDRMLRELNARNWFFRLLARWVIRHVDALVVDSPHCRENAAAAGLRRIVEIPEFIPPQTTSEHDRVRLKALWPRAKFVIGSNAFQISFHNNQDLYGIDLLIEMLARLSGELDVAIIFLLPGVAHEDYFQKLVERIGQLGLTERFVFIRDPLEEASSLWKSCDLMIRATNTDGNSLSILEAQIVGTPVIASDCVSRPPGVVPFKNRDLDDLVCTVSGALQNIEQHRAATRRLQIPNNALRFEALYRALWENRALPSDC